MTLIEIQQLTEAFSREHRALSIIIQTVESELAAVRKRYLRRIMDQVAVTTARKAALVCALEDSKTQFDKPRTRVFDGIKVGFRKLEGKIEIADEQKTVDKIYEIFPEEAADVYVKIEHTPVKAALEKLDAATLKKLGVQVTADTDAVVIKPLDGELEKLVAALLDKVGDEVTSLTSNQEAA